MGVPEFPPHYNNVLDDELETDAYIENGFQHNGETTFLWTSDNQQLIGYWYGAAAPPISAFTVWDAQTGDVISSSQPLGDISVVAIHPEGILEVNYQTFAYGVGDSEGNPYQFSCDV